MSEGTTDAMLMITVSWQALMRLKHIPLREYEPTDCTVTIFFISVFIESTLNYIIEKLHMTDKMKKDLKPKWNKGERYFPGFGAKISWFYNEFVARKQAKRGQISTKKILPKVKRKYKGFHDIYEFRNHVAHGKSMRRLTNPQDAERLRVIAKDIVDSLYLIGTQNNKSKEIKRPKNYNDVLAQI